MQGFGLDQFAPQQENIEVQQVSEQAMPPM